MQIFCMISLFLFSHLSSAIENCSLHMNPSLTGYQPDQVICKRNETYTVIEMSPETGAKCLDGSNYKFLFHEGSGADRNKFIFYFEGAAYCGAEGYETLESCYYRSLTDIGSSLNYGANGSIYQQNASMGYASSDKETNPAFANWNIVYLLYCDGTNAQSYLEEPLYFNNTPLWFRGFNNTLAAFEYFRQNMGLFNADTVFIAGGSSGGTSAMVWSSYLQDYFPKSVRLLGISDGGLFLDIYSRESNCYLFRFFMQNLANLTNSSSLELYRRCSYRNESAWKCMIPQYIYEDIEFDFFISNSQVDEQQLSRQLGVYCLLAGGPLLCSDKEIRAINYFREKHLKLALEIKKTKPSWGFWLRTCFEHTYHYTWAWYGDTMNVFNAESGVSFGLKDALYLWYNEGKKERKDSYFIDLIDWKHNPLCVYDDLYREQAK